MKTTLRLLFALFISAAVSSNAQQRIIAMSVDANPSAADTTEFGVPVIDTTTMFTAVMSVILANPDSIYLLHVKLGSSLHGSDFLAAGFNYGASGTFGTTSYSQTGNIISLGLGAFAGMINYFAEVQIEKSDHTYEDIVLFSNK